MQSKNNLFINSFNSKDINYDTREDYAKYILDQILDIAFDKDASDIHIEPFSKNLIIRLRIDGDLKNIMNLSMDIYPILSRVIKLRTGMNITEKRVPQDGRMDLEKEDFNIDIRASSIPTIFGEKIVLRILNRQSFLKDRKELGFCDNAVNKINNIINKKSGILLVTGPTGSGKTTTVYSILNDLRKNNNNIMTIEDPVEYKIEGINQIQVNEKVGLTFDIGLKSILRQDPDIIMIGEIRDIKTANIAIRAAITGHLVISTMHTNDAVSSIERLKEMGIPSYLISASVSGIISQKLIKRDYFYCNEDIIYDEYTDEKFNEQSFNICNKGNKSSSLGRRVIYEILEVDDDIRDCIIKDKYLNTIKDIAIENGMITFDDSLNDIYNVEEKYLAENI